jgi:hypothetical protein
MYPPPQADVALAKQPHQESESYGVRFGFGPHIKHPSNPPPFSYEYILEEGKMPVLAEFHPMHRKLAGLERSHSHHSPTRKRVQPVSSMKRSGSVHTHERQPLHFNIPVGAESTTEKLKRALSLSTGKTSSQPSRNPSSASRREPMAIASTQPSRNVSQSSRHQAAPLSRRLSNTSQPTPPPESRVPSLILPTPTPSPEPFNSSSSSPQKPPHGYGLLSHPEHHQNNRFSWASYDEDDHDDFAFLQESGMGRFNPSPQPYVNLRRNKAFELLGITNKGVGLPSTPTPSAATSYRPSASSSEQDHYSRNTSRRPSRDYRHSVISHYNHPVGTENHRRAVTPKTTPTLEEEETPRPPKQNYLLQRPLSKPEPPVFVRKSSPPRPEPIVVPDFPSPPVSEIRSTPSFSVPKPESPVHAIQAKPLVLAEPRPLPPLRGKTSRFIEHLDANAKRLSLPLRKSPKVPQVMFPDVRLMSDPDMIAPVPRRATSPLPAPMRALPSPKVPRVVVTEVRALLDPDIQSVPERDLSSSGVRRSVSMRESTSGPWGAVLCTAQARPIVATGHAKMVQSRE